LSPEAGMMPVSSPAGVTSPARYDATAGVSGVTHSQEASMGGVVEPSSGEALLGVDSSSGVAAVGVSVRRLPKAASCASRAFCSSILSGAPWLEAARGGRVKSCQQGALPGHEACQLMATQDRQG
jgi:hypothetical protein